MAKRVLVIGAGVTGLTAAYRATRYIEDGADVEVLVVERDNRVGGQLWTERSTDDQGRSIVVEGGSDSFLASKPGVHRIAGELGIADQIVGTIEENKGTFIVKDGRMVPLVDGMMMFAPTKIVPLATSSLYSWAGKLRMGLDLFIPKKVQPAAGIEDESLESLVVRRLGRECLNRVAEPLVGGVNGSDPKTMSILATYPMLLEMEQKYGSLIRGFLAQRKLAGAKGGPAGQKPKTTTGAAPKGGASPQGGSRRPRSMFASFASGIGFFTDTLAARIGMDNIRLSTEVTRIERSDDGFLVSVRATGSPDNAAETIFAHAVILTTGAAVAGRLLETVDSAAADIVAGIPNSSCATITMEFDESAMTFHRNWHGALSPAIERRPVTGISLVSSKWAGRTPDGAVQLRCFVGGARDKDMLDHSDEELIAMARESYAELLGLAVDVPARYVGVFRFDKGMPQYTVGHLDRMKELDSIMAQYPGLEVVGAAYRGVGVPNCVDSGDEAAQRVLSYLGFELEEGAIVGR